MVWQGKTSEENHFAHIDFIDKSTNQKGDCALGQAIAWYTSKGITVCIPLTESQPYDLVIDDGGLKKVEVKFTGTIKKNIFALDIRSCRLSANGAVAKKFDKKSCEELFVVTSYGSKYRIPSSEVGGKSSISLGPKYENFKVG